MSNNIQDSKQESIRETIFRFLLAYVFAFGFPFLAKIILNSNLSLSLILILVLVKPSLTIISGFTSREIKRVFIFVSGIYSFLFAFLITIGILITPANSYRALFKAMQANMRYPGQISTLFVLFLAFFSTTFSCTLIKNDYAGPFLGMALIISLLSGLIFQFMPIYIITIILILLCLLYSARRYLDEGNRVRNIVISAIIIGFCLGIGYGLHSIIQVDRSKVIDKVSTLLRSFVSKFFPQIPIMYELPEFGFAFDDEYESDLGSTPVLSNVPLFKVQGNPGDRTIYLRTKIYDQFEDNQWETSLFMEEKMHLNIIGIETETEEEIKISAGEGTGNKAGDEIALELLGGYFHLLPHTMDTVEFRFRRTRPNVILGDFDNGFYLDEIDKLISGDIIYLRRGRKKIIPPDTFVPYLRLPTGLLPEMKQMARTYETIPNPRDKIAKIKEDLILNYTYNIVTGNIRKNESFLDTFLFKTKQGYSVHFASALIILARCNDIPARYATGFLAMIPQPREGQIAFGGFKKTISGLSSHVWPEVWYDDTGWTIEEATPAVNPDFYTYTEKGILFNKNITLNSMTQQQISAIMGEPVISPKESKDISFGIKIDPVYYLYGIVFIVLVLLLIRYAYIFEYIFKKNIHTVIMLLRKIIKKHKKKGFPLPAEVGWIEWGEQIKQNVLKSDHRIEQFIQIVIRIMYGDFKVKKQDVKAVFVFYRKVKSRKVKQVQKSA